MAINLPPLPPGPLGAALADLAGDRQAPRLLAWRRFPPCGAVLSPLPPWLDPRLKTALAARGVTSLYSHQAASVRAARAGRHVLVATPTASGKSLCFHLPVLQALGEDARATALYLFPTKALARQQEEDLRRLGGEEAAVFACDGDTPGDLRELARARARVLCTNPETVHHVLLPGHRRWRRLWTHLRHVVVDEAHAYPGLAGCHLANLFRRLRRVAAFYGSRPAFLLGTATVADPAALARLFLDGEDAAVVTVSGAPAGERHFLIADAGRGREARLQAAVRVTAPFLRHRVPTLLFAPTRLECERLAVALRPLAGAGAVAAYRAGYPPRERRRLEEALRRGEVLALVATSALEVGIDAPSVGAVIICGFPGSVSSAWQQAGRAGRSGGPAAAVLVAGGGPLDRLPAGDPERFFAASPEQPAFDPDNGHVCEQHLACALAELPWRPGERFGRLDPAPLLGRLAARGLARRSGDGWHWCGPGRPHARVSFRADAGPRCLVARAEAPAVPLGEESPFSLPPGAVYLHGGRAYRVASCEAAAGRALVTPAEDLPPGAWSRPHRALQVTPLRARATRPWAGATASWGTVRVEVGVPSFATCAPRREEPAWARARLPSFSFVTAGLWVAWPPGDSTLPSSGGLLARRLVAAAAGAAGCDRRDLGCVLQPAAPPDRRPTLTVYEARPGEAGLCERLFHALDAWLAPVLTASSGRPTS